MNIEKSIKFPFTAKGWEKKVGIIFLLILVSGLITTFFSTIIEIPSEIIKSDLFKSTEFSGMEAQYLESISPITATVQLTIKILLLPITFYISGYLFELTGKMMKDPKERLPEHGGIVERLKLGAIKWLLGLPVDIIYAILFASGAALLAVGAVLSQRVPTMYPTAIVMIALGGLLLLFILTVGIVFYSLVKSSIEFNYLNKRDFLKSYKIGEIKKVIKVGWRKLLAVLGINIGLSIISFILGLILICFSFVVDPLIATVLPVISAHLYGQAFNEIKAQLS